MQHIFGLYECTVDSNWRFIPNDEVAEIIPMTINEITELMGTSPNRFTSGFKNTMKEYLELRNSVQ